jgi:hypothetical protein
VSPLYLYALLADPPSGALPAGAAGEPLRLVTCEGVLAAVGEVEAAPAVDAAALQAHDAVVRRLASASPAVLPARFGSLTDDERHLRDALRDRLPALRDALTAVRGCDQMTLRFSRPLDPPPPIHDGSAPEGGPGTRYLAARQALAGDPRTIPEVRAVLEALAPHVRGERRERHERPPLIASVYHLVPRGEIEPYREALAAAVERASVRVAISGPWPPYAFAPDALG